MKRIVLIFGAYGALGTGVTKTLLKKDYDRYYLLDFEAESKDQDDKRVVNINYRDLSEEKNVEEVFSRISVDKESEVYLFSTIGGFFGGKEVSETEIKDLDKMLNMNLRANFLIARQFLRSFYGRRGCLCFTSAFSGFDPEAKKAAYGLSKSALNYLINTLSLECQDKEIAVNGVAPYIIDTPENRYWTKDADYEKWQKPEEIGELINYIFGARTYFSGNIISLKIRFRR
jgi:NAD(P)-dependent dehydrogenase (short-subunit alcohol dehydrogenase family)